MAEMSNYCKAYPVEQFRQFSGWIENTRPLIAKAAPASAETTSPNIAKSPDGTEYFYLHDNFVVTAGIFHDQNVAFDRISTEWKQFCREVLKFAPPGA